jgi:hypothetical protein
VKLLQTLAGHQGKVNRVAFDPKGETLASGSNDGTVKLWEVKSGKLLHTLGDHEVAFYCVAFDPRGVTLASGGVEGTVKLWETQSGNALRTLEAHNSTVNSVAFNPQGKSKYDVFLSHNSKDKTAVEEIARELKKIGIRPWLDKWDLAGGDKIADALETAVKNINCAAIFFGPADKGKWHAMEIRAYLEPWAGGDARMIPVILPEAPKEPDLPIWLRQPLWVDMRDWKQEDSSAFYRLVCGILSKPPGDSTGRLSARYVWEFQKGKPKGTAKRTSER